MLLLRGWQVANEEEEMMPSEIASEGAWSSKDWPGQGQDGQSKESDTETKGRHRIIVLDKLAYNSMFTFTE